ncbi:ATP-binding cassette domain-containing protein [Bacillaceae bacterium S4-13-58]
MNPILKVNDISKHYHQPKQSFFDKAIVTKAVHKVSFELKEGEAFGLVGESGCGKSTTGQMLLQLIKQTSGTIFYKGEDVSKFSRQQMKAWRKQVQIVFQDPFSSLNPIKTIEWILEEPLIIHRIGNKQTRKQKILDTLADVGLDESYLTHYPHELSGGQRQRIAIASAIILDPEFIVIDEGVSALDVSVQAQILNLLKSIQQKYRLTYLFISHDLNIVQYFCDRIAIMYFGEIVELGTASEIGNDPKHPYTQALFSAIPSLEDDREIIVLSGDVPSHANPPSGCAFHTRCKFAEARCRTEKPKLNSIGEHRTVSCHLYEKEEGRNAIRRTV